MAILSRRFLPLAQSYRQHAIQLLTNDAAEIYNIRNELFMKYLNNSKHLTNLEKERLFDDDENSETRSWFALLIAADQGELL